MLLINNYISDQYKIKKNTPTRAEQRKKAAMDVSSSARKTFEAENNVKLVVDSIRDGIYAYDKHEQE